MSHAVMLPFFIDKSYTYTCLDSNKERCSDWLEMLEVEQDGVEFQNTWMKGGKGPSA